MTWTFFIRKAHRWVSLAFTLAVLVNIGAQIMGVDAIWIGLLALAPLILLLLSGLYLFALPYLPRSRPSADGRTVAS